MTQVTVTPKQKFKSELEKMENVVAKALPSHIKVSSFMSVINTVVNSNPKLLECTSASLWGAILKSSQLGLLPDGLLGQAHLIPYKKRVKIGNELRDTLVCNFQIGYKGVIQLIRRTSTVLNVVANAVYKGDDFEYDLLSGPGKHTRTPQSKIDDKSITHFYAIIKYTGGAYDFAIMSKSEVDFHKEKYSKGWESSDSAWQTAYVKMGKKTVLLQAASYAELSTDLRMGATLDDLSGLKDQHNAMNLKDVYDELPEHMQNEIQVEEAQIVNEETDRIIENKQQASSKTADAIAEKLKNRA